MKNMKRILAISLSAVMLLALLAACGGKKDSDVSIDLNALWGKITALGELPMLEDIPEEYLADLCGIDPADLEEYLYKRPGMNVQATEFFVAKVKEGKMDTVKAALESHQANLDAQWSTYLPDQYALVKNYKLTTNGGYIFFAVSEYAEQAEKAFNDAIAAAKS